MLATVQPTAFAEPGSARTEEKSRYLHGPIVDFLLLGGSSLLILPLMLALPVDRYLGIVAFSAIALSNVINHPHFAHLYQLFYRNFGRKISGDDLPAEMRVRYIVAGIVVPVLLVAFLLTAALTGSVRLVGLGGNIMALFVGWHYVKQGYGMLMVDAALKRRFFSDSEKKALLVNAYTVWGSAWLYLNHAAADTKLWDISYYTFAVPGWLLTVAALLVTSTSAATAYTLWKKYRSGKQLPWIGVSAYVITLYLWVLFVTMNPLWLLVVPALHSLQYLAVVYRFQTNVEKAKPVPAGNTWTAAFASYRVRLTLFAMTGLLVGAALFWGIPMQLDQMTTFSDKLFGPTLFLFICWVTINVHHYFMDSVMWRRENPETKLHLFG